MKDIHKRNTDFFSEDDRLFLDKHGLDIQGNISIDEAEIISDWIAQENIEHGPHMVEKDRAFIFESAGQYGCIKIFSRQNNSMVGFMGLYKYGDLYEAGSLFVIPEFRNSGVGNMIQANLLLRYGHDRKIFLVTSIDYARKINQKTDLVMVTREELREDILKTIESGGKMLSNDDIYANKCLLLNKNFNGINK
ncbi:GNAT family N-acetyltransferase [Candidatus Gracilibacteria bacterium]|nr:GNAT family N-acetyltransferase [Candidatus Gracilibacteria bacterium]